MQQTPLQKKTASSKANNRRKISANQSAQLGVSNQVLQNTINYPNTMKKKSSKANMLDPNGQALANGNQYVMTLQRNGQG